MKKTSNREGFPKDANLSNKADGQRDRNPEPRMTKEGGHTLGSDKIWSTGYPHRPMLQNRIQKLQRRRFKGRVQD